MPLDGLRAIAVLWVYWLHSLLMSNNSDSVMGCFYTGAEIPWAVKRITVAALQGGLAVDIFFVLSGFLISFILLKEFKKNGGKIDVWHFYTGRFFRLWPVMLVWALSWTTYGMVDQIIKGNLNSTTTATFWYSRFTFLQTLTFTNNWTGAGEQGWSLAVEFQFYLLSPLIVYWMGQSKSEGRAIMIVMGLCLLCLLLRVILFVIVSPELMHGDTMSFLIFHQGDYMQKIYT